MSLRSKPFDTLISQLPQAIREIHAMVDRETRAWNDRDAEALVDLFHPDMVWPWPPGPHDQDPLTWVMEWGRYPPAGAGDAQ